MMHSEETRMGSDGRGLLDGKEDLDIFEGLGKKAPAEPAEPAPTEAEPTDDVESGAKMAPPASVPPAVVPPSPETHPSLDGLIAIGDLLPGTAAPLPVTLERPFSPLLLESVPPPPPVTMRADTVPPPSLEESSMPPPGRDVLPSLAADSAQIPPPPPSDMETTNALPPVQAKAVRIEGALDRPWDDDQQATLVFDRAMRAPSARGVLTPRQLRRSDAPPSCVPVAEASAQLLAVASDLEPDRASMDHIMSSPPPPHVAATAAPPGDTESFTVPKLPDIGPLLNANAAAKSSGSASAPALESSPKVAALLNAMPEPPPVVVDDRELSGAFARLGLNLPDPGKAQSTPGVRAAPPPPPPPGVARPVASAAAPVTQASTVAHPTSPSAMRVATPHVSPPPMMAAPVMNASTAPMGAPIVAPLPSPGSPVTLPMHMPESHAPVTKPSLLPQSSPSVHVHPSVQVHAHPSSSRVPVGPPPPQVTAHYQPPPQHPQPMAPMPLHAPPPGGYARSHAPSPHALPMPPMIRSLEATHTIKRSDGRAHVFAVFAVVLAVATGVTFFMMPRPGALVVNVADNTGAAVPKLTVEIDGAKKCEASPCSVAEVEPGTHKVKITAPGFEVVAVRDVDVEAKQNVTTDFVLTPSKPPPGQGFKVTGSYPGLKVSIDGREIGQLGPETDLDVGPHKIHFAGDRYEAMDKTIIVDPGKLVDFGSLGVKVTKGKATITNETPGAKVFLVDGTTKKEVPQSPMAIEFGPNEKWDLLATKDGFMETKQPISFADGQAEKSYTIALTPKNAKAVAAAPKPAETKPADTAPAHE